VRPLIGLAAAAAVAALVFLPRSGGVLDVPVGGQTTLVGEEAVYVQFMLEAPDASSVQVAGDFNGWAPDVSLSDPDGDGVWSGRARLSPGIHKYMFLVNGNSWVTDPNAERYTEDGFGNLNAVLALPPGGGAGAGALAP
jgi:1,4-alpha-glucan branching enzyme